MRTPLRLASLTVSASLLLAAPGPAAADFAPRARVEVLWGGDWWPATVLRTRGELARIRYEGYDASDDEWVGPRRIRARRVAPLRRSSVEAESGGAFYPVRVLATRLCIQVRRDGVEPATEAWIDPRHARRAADRGRVVAPRAGDGVEVAVDGEVWLAEIVSVEPACARVHYLGYGADDDEWVPPQRLRRTDAIRVARAGDGVEVAYEGEWYPAQILETRRGRVRVHYIGYGDDSDEWVSLRRLRAPRRAGAPAA